MFLRKILPLLLFFLFSLFSAFLYIVINAVLGPPYDLINLYLIILTMLVFTGSDSLQLSFALLFGFIVDIYSELPFGTMMLACVFVSIFSSGIRKWILSGFNAFTVLALYVFLQIVWTCAFILIGVILPGHELPIFNLLSLSIKQVIVGSVSVSILAYFMSNVMLQLRSNYVFNQKK